MAQTSQISKRDIERLLSAQTKTILHAVDERFGSMDERIDERFAMQEVRIMTAVDKRLGELKQWFDGRLDALTTTLDHFLKRLSDLEDEFHLLKRDVARIKSALHNKLGMKIE